MQVSMADSSDDDALLGKTISEDGDEEALDKYLAMGDDWMHKEMEEGGEVQRDIEGT